MGKRISVKEYFSCRPPHGGDKFQFVTGKDGERKSVVYKEYKGEYDDNMIRFVGECVDCSSLEVVKVIYCD